MPQITLDRLGRNYCISFELGYTGAAVAIDCCFTWDQILLKTAAMDALFYPEVDAAMIRIGHTIAP